MTRIRTFGPQPALRLALALVLPALLASCLGSEGPPGDPATYPQRPITLLSWVTPGSPTDLLARAVARVGERHFGQRITVVNRPGGGGAVAMGQLVRQPPDGYTLAIMTNSGVVSMAAGQIPFQPDRFTYLIRIQLDPYVVAVRAGSPFRDLRDLFRYAAEHPGRLSVSGFGTASGHFLGFSVLRAAAGDPEMRWIAYEGSADAAMAALGGHTDAVNTNYHIVREQVRAGTMRVLGAASPLAALPDVATYRDQGFDVEPAQWRGLMGPAGMEPALVARIRELMERTVTDPEFQAFLEASATEPATLDSPEAFREAVHREVEEARAVLRELGLDPASPAGGRAR